jgi:hypothetical protein
MSALAVGVLVVALVGLVSVGVCRALPAVAGAARWLLVLLCTVVAVVVFLDVPFGSGTDELVYQHQAEGVRLSLVLSGGLDPYYAVLDPGKTGWPTVLGTLYYVVGSDNPYLGIVVNAAITYLALLLAVAAGARIHPDARWREWFGAVLVVSPPLVMYGPTLLRECWAWLTVALAIHGLIWLVRRCPWTGTLTVAAAALLAYWIRSPLAPILVAACVAGLVISVVWRHFGTKAAVVAFLCLGLAGRLALTVVLSSVGLSPEQLFVAREYLADVATTGFPPADPFTPVGLVESLVRVGLGPLPWELRPAPVWAWVLVSWAYWILVLVLSWRAVRRTGLDAATVAVLVFAVVLLAGLAVGLTNYGIVVRMRATVIIALLPVAWGMLAPARAVARTPAVEETA